MVKIWGWSTSCVASTRTWWVTIRLLDGIVPGDVDQGDVVPSPRLLEHPRLVLAAARRGSRLIDQSNACNHIDRSPVQPEANACIQDRNWSDLSRLVSSVVSIILYVCMECSNAFDCPWTSSLLWTLDYPVLWLVGQITWPTVHWGQWFDRLGSLERAGTFGGSNTKEARSRQLVLVPRANL